MNLIIIRLYFIYFWFLLFVSCVFIDTRARLHLVVWFNVFDQFQYYIVDGWNIFLIMRSALFSFTDLYIKTANYYFEESKNDWLNFIHLMPHIFIGRSKWNYFGDQTITYQNIPNYVYPLADFGVTGFDSAFLCNALFRI